MSSPEASFLFFSSQYISGARSPLAVATSFLLKSWNLAGGDGDKFDEPLPVALLRECQSIAYLLRLRARLCGHFLGPQAHNVLIGEHVPETVGAHHEGILSAQLGRGQIEYLNLSKNQEKVRVRST